MLADRDDGLKRPERRGEASQSTAETLVLFPGALGDACCFEPTVAHLARRGPVTFYARGGAAEVARLFPAAPKVRSLDAPEIAGLFASLDAEDVNTGWLDRFAHIVSFTGARAPELRTRLLATGRASIAPFPRGELDGVHVCDHFLRWASGDSKMCAPAPRLVSPDTSTMGRTRERPVLVVHPGAGAAAKRVPARLLRDLAERWRQLARGAVAIVLGPAEAGERDSWGDVADRVVMPKTVADLAAAISAGSFFVGNDSGPSHVAAALGQPGIALFLQGDPATFAPRSDRFASLRVSLAASGGAAAAADFFWRAVERALP